MLPSFQHEDNKVNVAIIGGGIAGLCLASGLLQNPNINVTIFEAASELAPVGYGLALGPNASNALHKINAVVGAEVEATATYNTWEKHRKCWFRFLCGQGEREGEVIAEPQNRTGQCTVHRAELVSILMEQIPREKFVLGKKFTSMVEQSGRLALNFEGGHVYLADCVFGCDGIRSAVRKDMFGGEHSLKFSGKAVYRALVPMSEVQEALVLNNVTGHDEHHEDENLQNACNWLGPGANVVTYPTKCRQLLNIVATSTRDFSQTGWPHETCLAIKTPYSDVAAEFADWHPRVRALISLLDKPETLAWSTWEYSSSTPTYSRGRVALVGDAAHAMTPFQGQGAAMAIEDAVVLSKVMAQVQTTEHVDFALRAYDAVRRPRAEAVKVASANMGNLLWSGHFDKVGAYIEKNLPWIWEVDLDAMTEAAIISFRNMANSS